MKKSQQKYLIKWEYFTRQLMDLAEESPNIKYNQAVFKSIVSQALVVAQQLRADIQGGRKSNEYIQGRLGYLYGLMSAATSAASNNRYDLIHPRALD